MRKKFAVVIGASRDLGKEISLILNVYQIDVLVVGRDDTALQEIVENNPTNINKLTADISDPNTWDMVVERIGDRPIDFLIHNASTLEPIGKLKDVDYATWRKSFSVNVDAPVFLTIKLFKQFNERTRILFLSSGSAYVPVAGTGAYCAGKAALDMLRKIFGIEGYPYKFSSVVPGMMDTELQKKVRSTPRSALPGVNNFIEAKQNGDLIDAKVSASFIVWILTSTTDLAFEDKEWNIDNIDHIGLWKTSRTRTSVH